MQGSSTWSSRDSAFASVRVRVRLRLRLRLRVRLRLRLRVSPNPNPHPHPHPNPNQGVNSGSLARVLSYGGLVLATASGVASHRERAAILESLSQVSWT